MEIKYNASFSKLASIKDLFIWSKEQWIITHDNKLYPTIKLKRRGLTVYREPISKVRAREEFLLYRVAPIWNKLPAKLSHSIFSKPIWTGLNRFLSRVEEALV